MICELKPPARPRSPVTSSSPAFALGLVLAQQRQARGLRARRLRRLAGHAPDRVGVGAQRGDALLGAAQARGGDHLHRARDLLDVLHRGDLVLDVALRGHGSVLRAALGRRGGLLLVSSPPARRGDLLVLQRLALLVEVVAEVLRRTPRRRRAPPSGSPPTSRRRRSSRAGRRAGSAVRSVSAEQELGHALDVQAVEDSRWWRRRSAPSGPRPPAARARAG